MIIKEKKFLLVLLLGSLFLHGCASSGMFGRRSLLADAALAGELSSSARALATEALEAALNSDSSAAVTWASEDAAEWGVVRPGQAMIAGLTTGGARIGAPAGLYVDAPLETALGEYDIKKNANVRLGPFTTAKKLTTLASGLHVRGLGRENMGDWILVARDNIALGYIYGPLLKKSAGGDLVLAGGPAVAPTYCRAFSHEINLGDGRHEISQGFACRNGVGAWRLAPKA